MSRRKGELTATLVDRGWPPQVALPEDACTGNNYKVQADFCRELSLCPRGKAVFHGDQWWRVFCFSDPIHADAFRERFGGEPLQAGHAGNVRRYGSFEYATTRGQFRFWPKREDSCHFRKYALG